MNSRSRRDFSQLTSFLSPRNQLEHEYPIPICKDLIVLRSLTIDKKLGPFVLKGEVLEFLSQ